MPNCDPLDDRQKGGGVDRVNEEEAGDDVGWQFEPTSRVPQQIDLLNGAINRLGCTGLVLFGQPEGHVGTAARAYRRTAQRRGDATSSRRIDSGETTAEL